MRTSRLSFIGAVAWLVAGSVALPTIAHADPAYTSEKVLDLFSKEKALKNGPARKVCFESDPACKKEAPPAPTRFDMLVNFDFNSDRLTPAARENLGQFAKALLDPRLKGSKFEIDGHTDATGAEKYNLGLSERRAKAVVDYLASLGVDKATLSAHGWGDTKPRVTDPFSPDNRRVESQLVE